MSEFLIWSAILFGGLILLALVWIVMRRSWSQSRKGSMQMQAMTLDDLDRMRETGLLDEEEYKRARRSVADYVVSGTMPAKESTPEDALREALSDIQDRRDQPAAEVDAEGREEPETAAPPKPAAAEHGASPAGGESRSAGSASSARGIPFDLERLRETGAIDEDEYERLSKYFRERS